MSVMHEPALADVQAVVEEVWSSFLGAEEPLLPAEPLVVEGWSAAVTTTGGWEGMVTVELTDRAAGLVTRVMLGLADDEPAADADIADTVGELVNMVGGNIKSLMPGPSVLSLPVVAAGRVARPSDAREVCRFAVRWRGEPALVCVHQLAESP